MQLLLLGQKEPGPTLQLGCDYQFCYQIEPHRYRLTMAFSLPVRFEVSTRPKQDNRYLQRSLGLFLHSSHRYPHLTWLSLVA